MTREYAHLTAKHSTRHWNDTSKNWDMVSDYLRILFEGNTAGEAVDKCSRPD